MQNHIELITREQEEFLVYRTGLREIGKIRTVTTKEVKFICGNCSQFPSPCPKIGVSKMTGTSGACDDFELSKREEDGLQG